MEYQISSRTFDGETCMPTAIQRIHIAFNLKWSELEREWEQFRLKKNLLLEE